MYTGSETEIEDASQFEDDDCDASESLRDEVFGSLDRQCGRKENTDEDELDELFFVGLDDEKDSVSDDTVKDYVKSFENMEKNGATNKETVESFKKAVKALQDFDEKAIEKELERGAKDGKVHSLYVLMHLKEVLEKSGFKNISFQSDANSGSVVLKNDKTETYIEMQYSREKGKEGASVKVRKN